LTCQVDILCPAQSDNYILQLGVVFPIVIEYTT
jgi:hypothetical protein